MFKSEQPLATESTLKLYGFHASMQKLVIMESSVHYYYNQVGDN